jgi:hypothetical protein
MSTHSHQDADDQPAAGIGPPTVAEVAELVARLRDLRGQGAELRARVVFLADKAALLARVPGGSTDRPAGGAQ